MKLTSQLRNVVESIGYKISEAIPTSGQIKRVQDDWTQIAGSPIEVEYIKGTLYGYGSELGVLKLEKKYKGNSKANSGYSENLKTHYFSLDIPDFSKLNLGESAYTPQKLYALWYKATDKDRKWKKSSGTMLNKEALEKRGQALKKQEGWHDIKVIEDGKDANSTSESLSEATADGISGKYPVLTKEIQGLKKPKKTTLKKSGSVVLLKIEDETLSEPFYTIVDTNDESEHAAKHTKNEKEAEAAFKYLSKDESLSESVTPKLSISKGRDGWTVHWKALNPKTKKESTRTSTGHESLIESDLWKGKLQLTLIKNPAGTYSFSGRVPAELMYIKKDGSDVSADELKEIKSAQSPSMVLKKIGAVVATFKTTKEAVDYAESKGVKKSEIDIRESLSEAVTREIGGWFTEGSDKPYNGKVEQSWHYRPLLKSVNYDVELYLEATDTSVTSGSSQGVTWHEATLVVRDALTDKKHVNKKLLDQTVSKGDLEFSDGELKGIFAKAEAELKKLKHFNDDISESQDAAAVSKEILRQLGGNKFIAMTGAKNFGYGDHRGQPYLGFKIPKNKSKANYVRIVLNSMDTYDMDFINASLKGIKEIEMKKGIYNDQLQEIFTEVTGLYTHL